MEINKILSEYDSMFGKCSLKEIEEYLRNIQRIRYHLVEDSIAMKIARLHNFLVCILNEVNACKW